MERHNIPTAAYKEFTIDSFEQGVAYIKRSEMPIVIKADGLAAGKGVVIAQNPVGGGKSFPGDGDVQQFGQSGEKWSLSNFLMALSFLFS